MDTQTRLTHLMQQHGLSRRDISALLSVSSFTVDSWLKPLKNKSFRRIPAQMLDLLEYRLSDERYKVPD